VSVTGRVGGGQHDAAAVGRADLQAVAGEQVVDLGGVAVAEHRLRVRPARRQAQPVGPLAEPFARVPHEVVKGEGLAPLRLAARIGRVLGDNRAVDIDARQWICSGEPTWPPAQARPDLLRPHAWIMVWSALTTTVSLVSERTPFIFLQ
jgi:hypothetical protein